MDGKPSRLQQPPDVMAKTAKIGRNDACPCGSGKKYKKCCGADDDCDSHYEIMKRIAYQSDIGRRREAFCLEMRCLMQAHHYEALICLQDTARSVGRQLTCEKGCSSCCTQYVMTSIQEAEAIVHYLYHTQEALSVFLSQYQTWKSWPGRPDADEAVCAAFINKDNNLPWKTALRAYNRLENPCPFLTDNCCSIYPVRPFACAGWGSTSPASHCRSSSPDDPDCMEVPLRESDYPLYLGYKVLTVGGMPQMVNRILSRGYLYLLDLLGIEDLKREVWSDPLLRGVLTRYQRSERFV